MSEEEPLITTELGLTVPMKPDEEWREHTAERWKRDDRESFDLCCALIRTGMVNQSELKRIVDEHRARGGNKTGVSRNTIHALMMSDEFGAGEIEEIIGKAARITTAQALDKVSEMVDKVKKPKDLGAVAMALTTVHNVKQISSGRPTSIVEKRGKFSLQDFHAEREKARARLRDVTPPTLELQESVTVPIELDGRKEAQEVPQKGE